MAEGASITLRGMADAQKQMERIERSVVNMARFKATLFNRRPYAYGQEFGTHRVSGKVARRGGGAMYLTRAVETVMSGADADISAGLNKVSAPGVWVLRRVALWARRLSRENVPQKTGKLWRSIKVMVEPK